MADEAENSRQGAKPRHLFAKGQSGNPNGRQKGTPNKVTIEIRELARRLLNDPEYQESLRRRLVTGQAQQIEALLYHYAYGKPKEQIEFSGPNGGPVEVDLAGLRDGIARRLAPRTK